MCDAKIMPYFFFKQNYCLSLIIYSHCKVFNYSYEYLTLDYDFIFKDIKFVFLCKNNIFTILLP